jgi:hypothetical protein
VPTSASQLPQSPILRRSNRRNLGQAPNQLIEGHSNKINLGKGFSRLDSAANLALKDPCFLEAEQWNFAPVYATNGLAQPYAFKASNSDPDTLSYDEAMMDPDRDLWIAAAKKEIKSLEDHGTWTEVDISEATSRILPSQ